MSRPLPLDGVRVVAIEQYGAGPFGSVHLADLGADVIKIEDPSSGGDVGRTVAPHALDDDSLFFQVFNRNKRSVGIDVNNTRKYNTFDFDRAPVASGFA